jgi:hypothetical protein
VQKFQIILKGEMKMVVCVDSSYELGGGGAFVVSVMLSEITIFEQCPKMLGAVVMIYSAGANDRKANCKRFCT